MINISFVELIPSLFLDEDEEEQQPYCDHQQVQRLAQDTEPERTLEIDAERAVEYPLREFYPNDEQN